jgi:hypothetical protein
MYKLLWGAAIAAAFAGNGVAIAQTPSPTQASHPRRSFFNASQPRAEVPPHVQRMFGRLDL